MVYLTFCFKNQFIQCFGSTFHLSVFVKVFLRVLGRSFCVVDRDFDDFVVIIIVCSFKKLVVRCKSVAECVDKLAVYLVLFAFFRVFKLLHLQGIFLLVSLQEGIYVFSQVG